VSALHAWVRGTGSKWGGFLLTYLTIHIPEHGLDKGTRNGDIPPVTRMKGSISARGFFELGTLSTSFTII